MDNEQNDISNQDYKDKQQDRISYLDIDPISYISNIVLQISKFFTKGKGLSVKGVNSFLLFVLTGSLLYTNTELPDGIMPIIRFYWVPFTFLAITIIDGLSNVDKINMYKMKIFGRTEFNYYQIMNDDVSYNDLELYSKISSFNKTEIQNIFDHLRKSDLLTPLVQHNLLYNPTLYKIDNITLIKELLLKFDWTSGAVCAFLSNTSDNLTDNYLVELDAKYSSYSSVKFALGHFHNLRKGSDPIYKLGENFVFVKKWNSTLESTISHLFKISFSVFIFIILLISMMNNSLMNYIEYVNYLFFITGIPFLILLILVVLVKNDDDIFYEKQLKEHIYDYFGQDELTNEAIDEIAYEIVVDMLNTT